MNVKGKYIKDSTGTVFSPIVSTDCVFDEKGNTVTKNLGDLEAILDGIENGTSTTNLQEKTVELTSSAATAITPDAGFTGMRKVTVTPKLQDKTQTITSNTTTTIKPDSGYVGLKSVAVTTNIATTAADPLNNVKINYNLGKDDKYTVTLAGTVKKALITFVLAYHHGGASAGDGQPRIEVSTGTLSAKSTPTYTNNTECTKPWVYNFTNTTGGTATITCDVKWSGASSYSHIHSYVQISY